MSSPLTRALSPTCATLHTVNDYDPERDGELLPGRDVMSLLGLRSRSTLALWRDRGDLIGYMGRNGQWRYPSRQPTLVEARAALSATRSPR